ncbi:MAG: hypothetical protein MJZ34_11320 [Paludibacteraceae bacterium]|nr:hypothetical protein [Paludibacteraceae bacterium]
MIPFTKKKIRMNNQTIADMFQYFNSQISQKGLKKEYSMLVYINSMKLNETYNEIVSKCNYSDPEFIKFTEEERKMVLEYADRNEQGEVKVDSRNQPLIIERIVEFNELHDKLREDNKEAIEKFEAFKAESDKYLQEVREIEVVTMDISQFPDEVEPKWIGILNINDYASMI